jgi:hypothetical protein
VQSCAYPACARTRLTSAAPSFQPAVNNGNDMQMDVVTSCIQAALASSGQYVSIASVELLRQVVYVILYSLSLICIYSIQNLE